ncbi:hypothetical protein BGZ98_008839 [Dissophora globulifera]|nr:hypothetical protein BGZ98_008839 [Dissophora globulifera]
MQVTAPSFKAKANDAKSIYRLQESFLGLAIIVHDIDQEMDNDADEQVYEVQKILGHRGESESFEYHVLCKGYDVSHASWEPTSQFNEQRVLEEYWNSIRKF